MKKYLLCLLGAIMFAPYSFSLQGGPDAYGYTWIDSNEPGGPVYNWIDITASGTPVTGLTDDNSAAFINMGMDFHYYWGDYNALKIGSNGWMSFENVANIAHCFPTIPSPGGAGDNFLAPYMTDLNFSGTGNPAQCMYFHDTGNNLFIITYLNTPWWTNAPPDWVGDNTFQVILDANDSSITFQYQMADAANFNDIVGCVSDIVIGIEGPTGAYGLQPYQDMIPPSNYAIKFKYPNPVLINVPDITPDWAMNTESGGEFHFINQSVTLPINIKNVGNIDVTSDIQVDVEVIDQTSTTVASYNSTISGGLTMGNDTTLQYSWTPTVVGQYSLRTLITNADDINNTNDTLTVELEIQDTASGVPSRFSYINNGEMMQSTIAWNSGSNDGVGSRFIPNSYPMDIDSIGAFVNGTGDVRLEIYADDGTNNLPGTLLHQEDFLSGSVPLNAWVVSVPGTPVTISSGGFYVVWLQINAANTSLGTILTPPFSRRSVESVSGWAVYRDNETQDFMLEAWGTSLCADLTSTSTFTEVSCAGDSDGAIDLTPVGGTSPYTFSWTGGAGTSEDPSGLPAGSYTVTITDNAGCQTEETIIVTEPLPITLSATSTDEIMGSDGTIDLTVSGGTAPYIFSWTGGAGSSEDPSGLSGGSYTVTVGDANGCTDTLTVVVNSQLGLESAAIDFNIYPNPSNGLYNIQIFNANSDMIVTVEDVTGRVIKTVQLAGQHNLLLDISDKAEGLYLVTIRDGKRQISATIVHQK